MIHVLGRPRSGSVYVCTMVVVMMSLGPLLVTPRLRINVARLLDHKLNNVYSKGTASTYSLPGRERNWYNTLRVLVITRLPLLVLSPGIVAGIRRSGVEVIHRPIDRGRGTICCIVGRMRYSLIDIGSVKWRLGYVTGKDIKQRYLAGHQTHGLFKQPLSTLRRRWGRSSTRVRVITSVAVGIVGIRRHAGGLEDSRNLVGTRDSPSAGRYSPTQVRIVGKVQLQKLSRAKADTCFSKTCGQQRGIMKSPRGGGVDKRVPAEAFPSFKDQLYAFFTYLLHLTSEMGHRNIQNRTGPATHGRCEEEWLFGGWRCLKHREKNVGVWNLPSKRSYVLWLEPFHQIWVPRCEMVESSSQEVAHNSRVTCVLGAENDSRVSVDNQRLAQRRVGVHRHPLS